MNIKKGDLVLVGPVHDKKLAIAIDRKIVSFGFEPDEWNVLLNGKIVTVSEVYMSRPNDTIHPFNHWYNYTECLEVKND